MRLWTTATLAVSVVLTLAIYGFDYYILGAADRPFSAKHVLLKPSGTVGIKLGMLGVGIFAALFLYPLRKKIGWLRKIGSTRHWLDFHIIAGLTAPVIIAFHSSFKFQGIAGMAFWIMCAVALSGIAGRYIYAQIPRSLNSAELSLNDLAAMEETLTRELSAQSIVHAGDLLPIFLIPTAEQVLAMPLYRALLTMLIVDCRRPFQMARLRRGVCGWRASAMCLGGFLRTENDELERLVHTARRKSALSKRIAFLTRSQQVFHLWHVVHRPFSYSFVVLAVIHIAVVIGLGYL